MHSIRSVDLNLIIALHYLLEEENVTAAAGRYGRSTPAMSRILTKLRETFEDPLLVRAGRRLTPTPRARELRPLVAQFVGYAETIVESPRFDVSELTRQFVIQSNEDVAAALSGPILRAMLAEAPNATLSFVPDSREGEDALRNGRVDIELGAGRALQPEIVSQVAWRVHNVGVARIGHPLFDRPITAKSYAAADHIIPSRRGVASHAIDEALAAKGLTRRVALIVPGARSAISVAAHSDLVASGPSTFVRGLIAEGMPVQLFELPIRTPELAVALNWHPQYEADPAHGWFRSLVLHVCRSHMRNDP